MNPGELEGVLAFLRGAEGLKTATRSGFTSKGEPESVADHTWRLCLWALALHHDLPVVDFARLVKICIVHDLGEAIAGDVPAPAQAAQGVAKAADERRDLLRLLEPLPRAVRNEVTDLWDEYEATTTAEAKLAKALDKLETILQHTQGDNPSDFDYAFNLGYGRQYTAEPPLIAEIRRILDGETKRRAEQAER
jgi:putative hydrolase of HD superfamily